MEHGSDVYRRDSIMLCDRFWDAVHLDSAYFDDDLSTCCNDEYAFFGDYSLDAFHRICTLSKRRCGERTTEDPQLATESPSTPRDFISMHFGTAFGTPVPSSPVEYLTEGDSASDTDELIAESLCRPRSPKYSHLTSGTPRPDSPAVSLLTMASSFLDSLLQQDRPPPDMKDTRRLLEQEYDVSIVESEVMVQVVEGAKWAGLWNSTDIWDDEWLDDVQSPTGPMIDTPTIDFDLYSQRMKYWRWSEDQAITPIG